MRKTGKATALLFLLLLGAFAGAAAQDVTVEAVVSETKVFSGERVRLSVEISGSFNDVSRPQMPEFEGFRLLSNTPNISRQFSVVNGNATTIYSYQYFLIAQKKGSYRIPPITVQIDGRAFQTQPIDVSVIDRNSAAAEPSASSRPDIFLRLDISDKRPVTGQQLIVDVVLYFKSGLEVNSYQPVPGWKAEGFWKEELESGQRPRAESVIIDGVRYRKARLLQFALFPTKAGKLTISPYEIIVSVRSTSSRDDPFSSLFGGFGSNQRRVELKSDPVSVDVEELPDISDAFYLGAVGSFRLSRSVTPREAVAGESIEIITKVQGTGNIPLISKPEYELPEGLEVYSPQENSSINRKNQRISGTKTFTEVVIARNPGTYTLPEAQLAYFNPSRNRYITETLPAVTFTVRPDPGATVASGQQLSFNIKPVTGLAIWTTPDSRRGLIARWWFWVGLLIPVMLVAGGYWMKTYREKMSSDRYFARSQKALRTATDLLDSAIRKSEQGDIKGAYNLLHKSLTGFIGDKLGLPEAGLSDRQYLDHLKDAGIDPDLIKNIKMLLDKCSTISFAPETSHAYLKSHVGLAEKILNQLKKEL